MSAMARTIRIDPRSIWRDGGTLLGATVATLLVMLGGQVNRIEGGLLLLGYVGYLLFVAVQERRRMQDRADEPDPDAAAEDAPGGWAARLPWWLASLVKVAIGLVGVILGADMVVQHGVSIATVVGVPGTLIGIFVGVGTSLPELVVSVQAAVRGAADISVGNIIGSGITNLLLCLGAAAAAHDIAVPATALAFDLPFLLVTTVIALALMIEQLDVTRAEGIVLCLLFGFYLYLRAAGVVL
jgi:cation:H+ antiporter